MDALYISGIVGIASSTVSSFVTWFLARKQQRADVDATTIQNLEKSISVYREIQADLKQAKDEALVQRDNYKQLSETLEQRLDEYDKEISSLKNQLIRIMSSICTDLTCQLRQRNMHDMPYLDGMDMANK